MKIFLLIVIAAVYCAAAPAQNTFIIDNNSPCLIDNNCFDKTISGGDTIFVDTQRTKCLIFVDIKGSEDSPVVIINRNGKVAINDSEMETAIELRNCSFIKLIGVGNNDDPYGFQLAAHNSGVSVTELSSNIEISGIKIKHDGFFGIVVKKDYDGNPPNPVPIFEKLVIHDCLVENVTEGMYLGETKTPGMEFKHVKVYNNIVANTGRDGIQVANMVEDIEVYNNLILNSGQDQLFKQGNNLQIGDNCVGDFYRNILLNANAHGIIVLGAGDINVSENYFGENQGLFIDNRTVTHPYSEIIANSNYFRNINDDAVVKIENELNQITLDNNLWYSSSSHSFSSITDYAKVYQTDNNYQLFPTIVIENYKVLESNSEVYRSMGKQQNLSHSFNHKPIFNAIPSIDAQANSLSTTEISAWTTDGDSVSFKLKTEHPFIQLNQIENGLAELLVNPLVADTGSYEIVIESWDKSHQHKSRQMVSLNIRNLTSNTTLESTNKVVLYPNPARDKIVLENMAYSIQSIELMNLSGITVQTFATEQKFSQHFYRLNRDKIKPGIYLLTIGFSNNTRQVLKLIVR